MGREDGIESGQLWRRGARRIGKRKYPPNDYGNCDRGARPETYAKNERGRPFSLQAGSLRVLPYQPYALTP